MLGKRLLEVAVNAMRRSWTSCRLADISNFIVLFSEHIDKRLRGWGEAAPRFSDQADGKHQTGFVNSPGREVGK